MATDKNFTDIDEYIAGCAPELRGRLVELRRFIQELVPEATEAINYRLPTFRLNGDLVYFAAFKNHTGFYPLPEAIETFKDELAGYTMGKGSIQFPHDQPLPFDLIAKLVRHRVAENLAKPAKRERRKPD
ncbi:MAG: hypothetical protein A2087_09710 [Spirochaetes bacterium GWD1_61_31]|nr:MAG: hypothetical protein A2Y37_10195 [Spirochaetes bacterium GWB1_60_80]OHD29048.1 MAG: hypothetical protein A2004_14445 [Spirochaetes bacterium GWC1_61_12]OHD35588.1 MAG: hypothetical protein A2087_09710 [Spirochaetes bacterium GWD1_61_31]OHD44215.1 MAG: hypothetical protein A2Y35_06650 [Spirochaetes bacterium GWE1_60_18]OHD60425.1 MAG: hypothetical protein A2Y32_00875 [Spirochaetes bacterium GWF1_60_12]HAP44471.1 hypothetical protein [Spirochaetaceae bacterium]